MLGKKQHTTVHLEQAETMQKKKQKHPHVENAKQACRKNAPQTATQTPVHAAYWSLG